ncbi:putative membrane-associated kinase regulator 2 [Wolffia australiana]
MEALGLLKYWRGVGVGSSGSFISAKAAPPTKETEDDPSDDDGPFFDLEFEVPDNENESHRPENYVIRIVQAEQRDEPGEEISKLSESASKTQMLPVSILRTKLRVFMLSLKKQKNPAEDSAAEEPVSQPKEKVLRVKFNLEEETTTPPLKRDYSARYGPGINEAEEKKPPKEFVQKYLGKMKPQYVRLSKRYEEKARLSGQMSPEDVVLKEKDRRDRELGSFTAGDFPSSPKAVQRLTRSGGLRVVYNHLGKSKSASAAVAAAPSPPPSAHSRRDDSLLQAQDGIQSAIAHCKMSLGVTKEPDALADGREKARELTV